MYTTLHCPTLYNAEQVIKQREELEQGPSEGDLKTRNKAQANFGRFETAIIEKLRTTETPGELLTQKLFDELANELDLPEGFVQPAKINYTVWSDVFICSNCGEEIVFWDAAVDHTNKTMIDDFLCRNCFSKNAKSPENKAQLTKFDQVLKQSIRQAKIVPVLHNYQSRKIRSNKAMNNFDYALIEVIESRNISKWIPSDRMPEGDELRRNDNAGITHTHHFYTKRNYLALSTFREKAENSSLSAKLKFLLTGMIIRSTLMNRIHISNYFFGGGGWNAGHLKGTLYIPSLPMETSVIEQIYTKDKSFRRAKQNINLLYSNLVQTSSATRVKADDNSIDYIFTDPPFGANIMYSELNFLWESWLKIKTNNETEAIENKSQNKTLLDYQELMMICFQEYFRILKPGNWMTVEFSNTKAAVWNGIQTALQRAGFIIANVAALDKKQGGMRAITTPTAVRQDLVISCYKPSAEFEANFEQASGDVGVWEFVREHLEHLPVTIHKAGNSTAVVERSPKILYDRLITFYLMRNMSVPIDATDFQSGLRQRFDERDGMFFDKGQAAEYDEIQGIATEKGQQLRLIFDLIYSESDALLWLQERLKAKPQTYQDIQPDYRKANVAKRKGEIPTELGTLLEENFIQMPDNKWRTPDLNEAKDREALRNKSLLREFDDYITLASGGKKLKEVRVEALRVGFKTAWEKKDFRTIVTVAEKIPNNILLEDEQLLIYYDIAKDRF